ncbi:MAG: YhjD/YihY/BrkB family envelope integrity protein [Leptospiraceae bacterium]|nr:YhjD/YihY/BrkB family envelope integrity protein [Leptospiraceae bacterium]
MAEAKKTSHLKAKLNEFVEGGKKFLGNLWLEDFEELDQRLSRLRRFIRMVIASVQKFLTDEALMRGATISYSLVVSFVPTLVVALLVTARFINTDEYFAMAKEFVRKNGIPLNLDPYIKIINELLRNAAAIGGVGFLIMLFSATSVLRNVESALNSVFRVKKQRPLVQKIAGFLMVMVFGPVLLTVGITYAQWLLGMFAAPNLRNLRITEGDVYILGEKHVFLRKSTVEKWVLDNIIKRIDFDYNNDVIVFNASERKILSSGEKAKLSARLGYADKSSLAKAAYNDLAQIDRFIWVITDEGSLLRSRDGGKIFHVQRFQREENGLLYQVRLNRILMLNRNEGIIIGSNGLILRTRNGGDSWEYAGQSNLTSELRVIERLENGKIVILGDNFTALISDDAGQSFSPWTAVSSLGISAQESYFFENLTGISQRGSLVAICGDGGLLLISRDGGQSFRREIIDSSFDFNSVKVVTSDLVIAVGDNGVIRHSQKTPDGNFQWVAAKTDTDVNLKKVEFLESSQKIVVVGDAYHILANRDPVEEAQEKPLEFTVIQKSPLWRNLISALGNVILPFIVIWILFFLVYKIIPYTQVTTKAAAIGAAVTSFIWVIFLLLFKLYVSSFSKGTFAIYGTLAAVPITLLLVYTSALIMLYGGEVAYFVQYPQMVKVSKRETHKEEEKRQLWYGLNILYHLAQAFYKGKGELPEAKLLALCNNDEEEFQYIMDLFLEKNYVLRTENKGYVLAEDPELIPMQELLTLLDANDYTIQAYNEKNPYMKSLRRFFEEIQKARREIVGKTTLGELIRTALA